MNRSCEQCTRPLLLCALLLCLSEALLVVALATSFSTGAAPDAVAGSIEGAPLRPGTVTVVTLSRLKDFRSEIDEHHTFDLDAAAHPFETYAGEHAPRVYRAWWRGWTGDGWRELSAAFEVNGATIILPLWRSDGRVRIAYLSDHLSERRYWSK